jgi:hypothetical protein
MNEAENNKKKPPSAESRHKMSEAKKGNKYRLGFKASKKTCKKLANQTGGANTTQAS